MGVPSLLFVEVPLSAWFNVLCDAVRPFLCLLLLAGLPSSHALRLRAGGCLVLCVGLGFGHLLCALHGLVSACVFASGLWCGSWSAPALFGLWRLVVRDTQALQSQVLVLTQVA